MPIDAQPTINALTAAIATANTLDAPAARGVLGALAAAQADYLQRWGGLTPPTQWLALYTPAFGVLDRHARYVSSLVGSTLSAIPSATDSATHDLLVARANAAAAAIPGSTAAAADLANARAAFDAAWSQNPITNITTQGDTSVQGLALTAAIASANQTIAYLQWSAAHPT